MVPWTQNVNWTYIKWDKVFKNWPSKIMENNLQKTWSDMVCLNRPYPFKFFKGCLPQILLGPFLNTLSQMSRRRPGYLLNVLCAFSLRPVSKGSIETIQILIHTTNFEKIFSSNKYRSIYETKPVEPSTLRSMQIFNFLF